MIGTLLGLVIGIGLVIQAWTGSGITPWTGVLVVVPFLLGLVAFTRTMGIMLMWVAGLSLVALIVSVVRLDWPSVVGALGMAVAAFAGQLALGRLRPQAT